MFAKRTHFPLRSERPDWPFQAVDHRGDNNLALFDRERFKYRLRGCPCVVGRALERLVSLLR